MTDEMLWDARVTWRQAADHPVGVLEYATKVESYPTEQAAWAAGRRRAGEIKAKRGAEVVADLEVLVTSRRSESVRSGP